MGGVRPRAPSVGVVLDHAVDFGKDIAIAEIEFRIVQIPLRLRKLRLGLLQGGRLVHGRGVNPIDVSTRVAPIELGDHLLRGELVGAGKDPQRSCGEQQVGLRLPDGGEGLGNIVRHFGQRMPVVGLRGKTEGGAGLNDILDIKFVLSLLYALWLKNKIPERLTFTRLEGVESLYHK